MTSDTTRKQDSVRKLCHSESRVSFKVVFKGSARRGLDYSRNPGRQTLRTLLFEYDPCIDFYHFSVTREHTSSAPSLKAH